MKVGVKMGALSPSKMIKTLLERHDYLVQKRKEFSDADKKTGYFTREINAIQWIIINYIELLKNNESMKPETKERIMALTPYSQFKENLDHIREMERQKFLLKKINN